MGVCRFPLAREPSVYASNLGSMNMGVTLRTTVLVLYVT